MNRIGQKVGVYFLRALLVLVFEPDSDFSQTHVGVGRNKLLQRRYITAAIERKTHRATIRIKLVANAAER